MDKWISIFLFAGIMVLSYSCKSKSIDTVSGYSGPQVKHPDLQLIVHLRGINDCKIRLSPKTGARALSSIEVIEKVRKGESDTLIISGSYLPGEFVLSFDCTGNSENMVYHSERTLIVSDQDLELWINPISCNNEDSTWFNSDEVENTAYNRFLHENAKYREPLSKLYDFLLNSNDKDSKPYRKGVKEFEKRRISYNRWITKQANDKQAFFSGQIYQFHKISKIDWKSDGAARTQSQKDQYLDEIDLSNPMIIKTTGIKSWIEGYVALYDEPYADKEYRDSILKQAGYTAMEKARAANPYIYGWMADYFYSLYEKNGLINSMIMLQSHLEDPNCLTSQKRIFQRRSIGQERISIGKEAPDFHFINETGLHYKFHNYKTEARYKLLMFWNSGCWTCIALSGNLYTWYQQNINRNQLKVFAVNFDEEYNTAKWEKTIIGMPLWEHMIDDGGIDSEVANAYCVLSTPEMILIDAQTNKIVALPNTIEELNTAMGQLK